MFLLFLGLSPFHRRFRSLVILSAIGGVHSSYLDEILKNAKPLSRMAVAILVKCAFYSAASVLFFMNIIHMFFLWEEIREIFEDLMMICLGVIISVRVAYLNFRRQFENVIDTWEKDFGADEYAAKREVYQ